MKFRRLNGKLGHNKRQQMKYSSGQSSNQSRPVAAQKFIGEKGKKSAIVRIFSRRSRNCIIIRGHFSTIEGNFVQKLNDQADIQYPPTSHFPPCKRVLFERVIRRNGWGWVHQKKSGGSQHIRESVVLISDFCDHGTRLNYCSCTRHSLLILV